VRILMTSTSYPESPDDWRGRFIANLVESLARREELELTLWAPPGQIPPNVTHVAIHADAQWLRHLAQSGGIAHTLRQRGTGAVGTVTSLLFRLCRTYRRNRADVFHINWLQNALPLWGTQTPALISVLGTDLALLELPGMVAALRQVMRQRRTILAPNATWMTPELERQFGDVAEIRPIFFGVDGPWFGVVRRPPTDGTKHWLCITRLTKNKIGDLFAWGEGLFGETRRLHLFGPMQEQVDIPAWVDYHGPTYPAQLLGDWFPQASGLITLSCHDEGRPQVMLEAMAAGLPILASELPAHRDMLRHEETGWLAASAADVRRGLDWLEEPERNARIGKAAQDWVRESIGTWDECAGLYAQAYRNLLEHI